MNYSITRHRILRASPQIRRLVAETSLTSADFLVPLFIVEGENKVEEIPSMPGYYRRSLDKTLIELKNYITEGLSSFLLFVKVPDDRKDNKGTEALNENGLMQRAIRSIKDRYPDVLLFTDVALDPYSSFGHDGVVEKGRILNDPTVEVLTAMALSHVKAGADFVAPSDMMDGRIGAIRTALEKDGWHDAGILSYSAKYASSFYGPFRDALDSAPGFGDKKTYQMNPANVREALNEVEVDVKEGADIIMVKPAMAYLDVIAAVKHFINQPVAAYQVSGEYAMICAAAQNGWINRDGAIVESLLAIKRAGADIIATYFAREVVGILGL
ncbi:MAG: porphobilinogen synthase [Bacteroidetes bacterium]|nr:MAG: porphobilinogen synthase [Bacteroidota bacterium]